MAPEITKPFEPKGLIELLSPWDRLDVGSDPVDAQHDPCHVRRMVFAGPPALGSVAKRRQARMWRGRRGSVRRRLRVLVEFDSRLAFYAGHAHDLAQIHRAGEQLGVCRGRKSMNDQRSR
jgi:hypothetical protein